MLMNVPSRSEPYGALAESEKRHEWLEVQKECDSTDAFMLKGSDAIQQKYNSMGLSDVKTNRHLNQPTISLISIQVNKIS